MSTACDVCEKTFTTRSVLNRHLKEVHKVKKQFFLSYDFDRYNNKCFACNRSFKYVKDLREHLVQEHNFQSEVEELSFRNVSEFEVWLEETCRTDKVQYILTRGTAAVNLEEGVGKVSVYCCNRSGKKVRTIPDEQRKRMTKTQGSSKLDFACTSQIKLTEIDGFCFATYYKTHYRHDRDLKHLPISKSDKEKIAQKLIAGTPIPQVLNEFRDATRNAETQRISLLTRKDVENIKQAYKIGKKREFQNGDEIEISFEFSETQEPSDLKVKIMSEIKEIAKKVENNEVAGNVLGDVYELLQVATTMLKDDGANESANKIETYFLTVDNM